LAIWLCVAADYFRIAHHSPGTTRPEQAEGTLWFGFCSVTEYCSGDELLARSLSEIAERGFLVWLCGLGILVDAHIVKRRAASR
jgi:hypothetical protein